MKKRKFGKIFLRGFCKTSMVILMMVTLGFISYKVTYSYYSSKEIKTDEKTEETILNLIGNGEFQEVSKNIIYGVKEQTGQIKYAMLEIFNTKTKNLDYITVPVNGQITFSNETYQKLFANNVEIPQIVLLGQLHKHFEGNAIYQYGMAALQDLLNTKINYYTVMSEESFKNRYNRVEKTLLLRNWKRSYKKKLRALKSKEQIESHIKEYYETIKSNLTLQNKLKYVEFFMEVNLNHVYFHLLPIEEENGSYTIIGDESKELINGILNSTTYKKKQNLSQEKQGTINKNLKIRILNSTKINGLASFYKGELERKGYQFIEIGNYTGGILDNTKINVATEEIKSELRDCIKVGEPEVMDTLGEDVQVQIILGLDADHNGMQ